MGDKIRLPSTKVVDRKPLNGSQWKQCIVHARKYSFDNGVDMGDYGYWLKYAEFTTGMSQVELEMLSLEDLSYLIDRLQKTEKVGPKGPKEKDSTIKN